MALEKDDFHLQAPITVDMNGELIQTTAGRLIFNSALPDELGFSNQIMDRKGLKELIARCYRDLGPAATATLVDGIKGIGFHYATVAGITIGIDDIRVPKEKVDLLAAADKKVADIDGEFRRGFITDDERYTQTVEVWRDTTDEVTAKMLDGLDRKGSVWMITHSGARGNVTQVHQLAGMRGLMADPSGRIIDLPIRSNLREGMSVLEYFISSPRRPQGSGRHRPPDGGLGLPDPPPGGRGPGRHHPRGRLRDGPGDVDHPRGVDRHPRAVHRSAHRPHGGPRRGRPGHQEGHHRAERGAGRGGHRRHRRARTSTASTSARRSPALPATACAACATAATWPPVAWSTSDRRWASSPPSPSVSRAPS